MASKYTREQQLAFARELQASFRSSGGSRRGGGGGGGGGGRGGNGSYGYDAEFNDRSRASSSSFASNNRDTGRNAGRNGTIQNSAARYPLGGSNNSRTAVNREPRPNSRGNRNASVALDDDGFRRRLAEFFDENVKPPTIGEPMFYQSETAHTTRPDEQPQSAPADVRDSSTVTFTPSIQREQPSAWPVAQTPTSTPNTAQAPSAPQQAFTSHQAMTSQPVMPQTEVSNPVRRSAADEFTAALIMMDAQQQGHAPRPTENTLNNNQLHQSQQAPWINPLAHHSHQSQVQNHPSPQYHAQQGSPAEQTSRTGVGLAPSLPQFTARVVEAMENLDFSAYNNRNQQTTAPNPPPSSSGRPLGIPASGAPLVQATLIEEVEDLMLMDEAEMANVHIWKPLQPQK